MLRISGRYTHQSIHGIRGILLCVPIKLVRSNWHALQLPVEVKHTLGGDGVCRLLVRCRAPIRARASGRPVLGVPPHWWSTSQSPWLWQLHPPISSRIHASGSTRTLLLLLASCDPEMSLTTHISIFSNLKFSLADS